MKISCSVIVPFMNESLYIRRCLEALAHQEFEIGDYEIILIDNNSTDESKAIAQEFKKVVLLAEPLQNVYVARNRGLLAASGEIVVFTDSDCVPDPNWLNSAYSALTEDKKDIALGLRRFPRTGSRLQDLFLQALEDYENHKIKYVLSELDTEYFYGFTNNMAVRSALTSRLKGFRTEFIVSADTDFVVRAASESGVEVNFCPEMIITHLEIKTPFDWFRKIYRYAKHNVSNALKSNYRPIPFNHQWEILKLSCSSYQGSYLKILVLLLAVSVGFFYYSAGRCMGNRRSW